MAKGMFEVNQVEAGDEKAMQEKADVTCSKPYIFVATNLSNRISGKKLKFFSSGLIVTRAANEIIANELNGAVSSFQRNEIGETNILQPL